jgi:hypothetical protein
MNVSESLNQFDRRELASGQVRRVRSTKPDRAFEVLTGSGHLQLHSYFRHLGLKV